jgi:hypothetical protein
LLCRTWTPHELGGGDRRWYLYPPLNHMFKFRSRVWWESTLLLQICSTGTTTWRPPRTVWWKLQNMPAPKVSVSPSRWSWSNWKGTSSRGKALSQRNEDTFASSSRPSVSYRPSFVILSSCIVNRRTCKNVCDTKNIFVLRAIHFSIGHFPFVGIFVLKAASSRCRLFPFL